MKTPKNVELDITTHCNLFCKYCSHYHSAGDVDRDLPTSEWLQFFEELGRCAVMDLTLCGGEPFFRKDLKEFIGGIVKNRMRFSILSNGTLINDEMALFLKSTKRCNNVQVSIDGSCSEIHDSCRGKGNFDKAVEGLKCLRRNGVSASVRVTIHKYNVRDLDKISALLIEEIGLSGFSTNSASHMGMCRDNADDTQLNIEEYFIAMESLLKLNQKYKGKIGAAAGPLASAKSWLEMEESRLTGKEKTPGRGFLVSCGGVFSKMAVRADGVMTPCGQMGHIELGRINKDDLKEVWQNHPEMERLRKRRQVPLDEFEFCKGCDYIPHCAGGCPALAYTINGDDFHPSSDSCLKNYLKKGGKLPNRELLN